MGDEQVVAVTGASGFLGAHICQALLQAGTTVVGVVRNPERAAWLVQRGVELRTADLLDQGALQRALEGVDAVVSNASIAVGGTTKADVARLVKADCQGSTNLIAAALHHEIRRYVHISSVSVYRWMRPWQRVGTDHPIGPGGFGQWITKPGYAQSKAATERVVWEARDHGLEPTILRPGPVYGSRDSKLTQRYAQAMKSCVQVVPTVRVPHVHAGDVGTAVVGALRSPYAIGRAYNVTGSPVSLWQVARAARTALGSRTWLVPLPVPLWLAWDNSDTRSDLGVRFRPVQEGMREAMGSAARR